MTCFNEDNAGLLMAYFENTLPEAERRAVDAHAAGCAACRQMLALHTMLDQPAAPPVFSHGVSHDFDARLYARIAAFEISKPWWYSVNWRLALPMTAVAAMLAVGFFLFQSVQAPVGDDGQKQAVNRLNDSEIQQLEKVLADFELLMPVPAPGDAI